MIDSSTIERTADAGARSQSRADLSLTVITDLHELESLQPEWRSLFVRSGCPNPFATPEWQLAWARHFTAPGELLVPTVRRGGELVAVAPFYRGDTLLGRRPLVRRVRLFGRGRGGNVTELPQILTLHDSRRKAMAAVLSHLMRRGEADWVDLSLAPEQGWVEPEWLPPSRRFGTSCVTLGWGAAATPVMALPADPHALEAQLKRNLRANLRRSANRLRKAGSERSFEVVDRPGAQLEAALAGLVALHRARARMDDHLLHHNQLAAPGVERFLHTAAQDMAAAGQLKLWSLLVGGRTIASLMAFRAGRRVFFGPSGIDPDWWGCSPMALLRVECLRDAIACGDTSVNFSRGPNRAKLDWTEELEYHHHFTIVAGTRRARALFSAYAPYRAAAEYRSRARPRAERDA